jgi:L-cysteine S-thiosulfotransferase
MQLSKLKAGMAAAVLCAGAAHAGPVEDTLILNDEIEMITVAPAPAHLDGVLGDTVISGWLYREAETRDVQRDDFENPASLFVEGPRAKPAPRATRGWSRCAASVR